MSDFSVEVLYRSEQIFLRADLGNDCSLEMSILSREYPKRGHIAVTYEKPDCYYNSFFANWDFKTDTTTQKFLAGYDTEALVEDLFKYCDMPHDEKLYIANTIIWACEKLENEEVEA